MGGFTSTCFGAFRGFSFFVVIYPDYTPPLSLWHNLGSESLDDEHLAKLAADPKISAKAEAFTVAIEREAAEQRDAIAAIFGTAKPATSRG